MVSNISMTKVGSRPSNVECSRAGPQEIRNIGTQLLMDILALRIGAENLFVGFGTFVVATGRKAAHRHMDANQNSAKPWKSLVLLSE